MKAQQSLAKRATKSIEQWETFILRFALFFLFLVGIVIVLIYAIEHLIGVIRSI